MGAGADFEQGECGHQAGDGYDKEAQEEHIRERHGSEGVEEMDEEEAQEQGGEITREDDDGDEEAGTAAQEAHNLRVAARRQDCKRQRRKWDGVRRRGRCGAVRRPALLLWSVRWARLNGQADDERGGHGRHRRGRPR